MIRISFFGFWSSGCRYLHDWGYGVDKVGEWYSRIGDDLLFSSVRVRR